MTPKERDAARVGGQGDDTSDFTTSALLIAWRPQFVQPARRPSSGLVFPKARTAKLPRLHPELGPRPRVVSPAGCPPNVRLPVRMVARQDPRRIAAPPRRPSEGAMWGLPGGRRPLSCPMAASRRCQDHGLPLARANPQEISLHQLSRRCLRPGARKRAHGHAHGRRWWHRRDTCHGIAHRVPPPSGAASSTRAAAPGPPQPPVDVGRGTEDLERYPSPELRCPRSPVR